MRRLEITIRTVALLFVIGAALARWDTSTGFTAMPRFGERFAASRIPELRALPIASASGMGYDGQWYATLAANPRVTDSSVIAALDKPSYRSRRILIPLAANLLAGGDAWNAVQIFVLLHMAAWLTLALLFWRVFPIGDWRATAGWSAAVLGTGALDSLRMTLTDLPAAVFLVGAVIASERMRNDAAAGLLLFAGFTRELSLGALLSLRNADGRGLRGLHNWLARAAVAAPVILWCLWLAWRIPGGVIGHEGNIDWPGRAFAIQLATNVTRISAGDMDSQWWFGIAGGAGLAAQSAFLLRRWRSAASERWIAAAIPFGLLFWIIGADPWIDYRAVARDCLPMTLGFAVVWWRSKASAWWLLAQFPIVADGLLRATWPNG